MKQSSHPGARWMMNRVYSRSREHIQDKAYKVRDRLGLWSGELRGRWIPYDEGNRQSQKGGSLIQERCRLVWGWVGRPRRRTERYPARTEGYPARTERCTGRRRTEGHTGRRRTEWHTGRWTRRQLPGPHDHLRFEFDSARQTQAGGWVVSKDSFMGHRPNTAATGRRCGCG
jgi:hypothetical protein